MCDLYVKHMQTAIGIVKVSCCEKGVHEISFCNSEKAINIIDIKNAPGENPIKLMSDFLLWLRSYFEISNQHQKYSLPPVCPVVFSSKGKFTEKVWKTLMSSVPPGETISYGNLAALCGNAAASRAVGTAMKNNPIPLLIPCHRVIRSDGCVGHYSGGRNIKEWLLHHETM